MKPIAQTSPTTTGFIDRVDEGPLLKQLIRPHFPDGVERLLIFGFDEIDRLVGMVESEANHVRHAFMAPPLVRQAFSFANASRLMLAHNHLSDEGHPSWCDLDLTRRLAGAAKLMDLVICDHIILTSSGHFSFRNAGLV